MKNIFETSYFFRGNFPRWPCPSCEDGWLVLQKDKFDFQNDAITKHEGGNLHFEPESFQYVFMCMMECNSCEESVTLSGTGGVMKFDDPDTQCEFHDYFTPKFFQPALHIIDFKANTTLPEKVRKSLESSFPLFWCDYDACANRVRATLEFLLDSIGIPRKLKQDARKEMTLHDRIEKISAPAGSENDEVKQLIMAVKWLGNAGSHELEGITRAELIQGYKMIELCLRRLYPVLDHEAANLVTIAKTINAEKQSKPRL